MAEKDGLAERGKGLEEEYFRKREAELLEKVRRKAAQERERRALGEHHGVTDEEILKGFEELGYNRDTVRLLHLVPILQVAWADGELSKAERAEILKIAAARGVAPGTPAHDKLLEWLTAPPAPAFFERTVSLLTKLVAALPEEKRASLEKDVLGGAQAVAEASGWFLGLAGKVSAEEKALLERFRAEFEKAHRR